MLGTHAGFVTVQHFGRPGRTCVLISAQPNVYISRSDTSFSLLLKLIILELITIRMLSSHVTLILPPSSPNLFQ